MLQRQSCVLIAMLVLVAGPPANAAETLSSQTKSIPKSRPELKAALESLKHRQPRLPFPPGPPSEGTVANGRMREYYLPKTWNSTSATPRVVGRPGNNGAPTLDFVLTTSCFWIVSRGNNCHYCLGHQELKLAGAGLKDDLVAALDSDWQVFQPRERAAFTFARRLTLEPEQIADADLQALKPHFTDAEIIELTFAIARFNATNRWTDGLGLPQDQHFGEAAANFETPTSDRFTNAASLVDPTTRKARLPLPSADDVRDAIEQCRSRIARVTLPTESQSRATFAPIIADRPPLAWERALSQITTIGPAQVAMCNAVFTDDTLPPQLKAELALITALHNRAWYSAALAIQRLRALSVSDAEIADFQTSLTTNVLVHPAHRLAAKLTTSPHLVNDQDLAQLRATFSDRDTARIVHVICTANFFDRFTEALGLPIEIGDRID